MTNGSITLFQVAAHAEVLAVACSRCDRAGRYRLDTMIARHGPDFGIPELLRLLSADCPKRHSLSAYDLCGVHCPELPGFFSVSRRPYPAKGRKLTVLEEKYLDNAVKCALMFLKMKEEEAEPIFRPYLTGLTMLGKSDAFFSLDQHTVQAFHAELKPPQNPEQMQEWAVSAKRLVDLYLTMAAHRAWQETEYLKPKTRKVYTTHRQ
jgi:hypothetical protein